MDPKFRSENDPHAEFRERTKCIACGSDRFTTVWAGRFCDEPIRSHLQNCFYSSNVLKALENESFCFVQCRYCNQRFHQRILTPKWLHILYNRWIDSSQIERFEKVHCPGKNNNGFEESRQFVKHVLRLEKLLRGVDQPIRLLDYGCGDGNFLALAAMFEMECYGIDFSISRAERAKRSDINIFPDLTAFDECVVDRVDAVTMLQVLEHIDEPLHLLQNLKKRMIPGGILIAEVPDCRGVKNGDRFEDFHKVHVLEHINAFTPTTLKVMLENAGFRLISKPPAHVSTHPIQILKTELSRFVSQHTTEMYFRSFD